MAQTSSAFPQRLVWTTLLGAPVMFFLGVAGVMLTQRDDPAPASAVNPPLRVAETGAPRSSPSAAKSSPNPDDTFVIKRVLPISGPIRYGEWHWNDKGVPPGPTVITVDLDARVLSIFRGGHEIGAAAVLLGTEEKPTPLGEFRITQKRADHVSNLYDAPMPYMMRLTNDGITIHGTSVRNGYASHGCVGTPTPFARKLFGAAKIGDRVFITRGKRVGVGDDLIGT